MAIEVGNDIEKENSSAREKPGILAIIRSNWLVILIISVLIVGYFMFRTTPSDVGSLEEFTAILNGGKPVLVEFYANT